MRALRRIATPASVLVLSGCTYPFEDYLPQSSAVTTNDTGVEASAPDASARDSAVADTRVPDTSVRDTFVEDTFVEDTFVEDTFVQDTHVADTFTPDTAVATDTGATCTCVFWAGPKCKTWSPPGCGD